MYVKKKPIIVDYSRAFFSLPLPINILNDRKLCWKGGRGGCGHRMGLCYVIPSHSSLHAFPPEPRPVVHPTQPGPCGAVVSALRLPLITDEVKHQARRDLEREQHAGDVFAWL